MKHRDLVMRWFVALTLMVRAAMAQSPYPPCAPPPEVAAALDPLDRQLPGLHGPEIMEERWEALRVALQRFPGDFFVLRQWIWHANGRRTAMLSRQLQADYQNRLSKSPHDPVLRYLQAMTLFGTNTAAAIPLFEKLAADHPRFAWPRLTLASIHSYPAFVDEAKMQSHSLAFLELCPDSLEPYQYLMRTVASLELAETGKRLRLLLGDRADVGAMRARRHLWTIEFKTTGQAGYDAIRQRVAEDIRRLASKSALDNQESVVVLRHGARLVGDKELEQRLAEREEKLRPGRVVLRAEMDGWNNEHPYPNTDSPPDEFQEHRRARLASLDEWSRRDPDYIWLWLERLGLLAILPGSSGQELLAAGEQVLRIAGLQKVEWHTTPPELMVARHWATRGVGLDRLPGLVDLGLSRLRRMEEQLQESDLMPADVRRAQERETRSSNRLRSLEAIVTIYVRTGRIEQAKRALVDMEAVVTEERSYYLAAKEQVLSTGRARAAGGTSMDRQRLLREFPITDVFFHRTKAEVALADSRPQVALAHYGDGLRASYELADGGESMRRVHVADARAVWDKLGGTEEDWKAWLAGTVPKSGPTALPDESTWVRLDEPLIDFTVKDLQGAGFRSALLRGSVTLINVWATWCGPCVAELPTIQALHERLADRKGIRVITLNTDLNTSFAAKHVRENGFTFPVMLAQPIVDRLLPFSGIPRTWIVDRKGMMRWESTGFEKSKADSWLAETISKIEELAK